MSRERIHAGEFGAAMVQALELYDKEVQEGIAQVTEKWTLELVRKTKATAPKGPRNGQFKKNITANFRDLRQAKALQQRDVHGIWYVKAPDYRLTHLIVHGHATKDGGRTRANPFLQNALDTVLPEYEKGIEEVLKNGR